jgi:hypothetical protein
LTATAIDIRVPAMAPGEDAISVLTVAVGDLEEEGEKFGERGQCQRDEVNGFRATYLVGQDSLAVRDVLFTKVTSGQIRHV